jgi:hypothetical protein
LAFGEEGVEGEGGFAAAGDAGEDDELFLGDGEVDAFEVVFAGAADDEVVELGDGGGSRSAVRIATSIRP